MRYAEESLSEDFIREVTPLLQEHWLELSAHKDIPLEPDWEFYFQAQSAGLSRIYTARNSDGRLVGYACFMVRTNPHYKSSLQAACDVFFIDKGHRSMVLVAKVFVDFCDAQLKKLGVQLVHHRYKLAQPALGRIIKKMGYVDVEVMASRRL